MPRRAARAALVWYFALVLLGSVPCYAAMIAAGTMDLLNGLVVLILMWVPGLASLLLRWVRREGFADVSFRLRGPRVPAMSGLAWSLPLVVGLSAYPLAWLTGLERFEPSPLATVGMERAPPLLQLTVSLALNMTLGTALSAVSAAGEEIGWRGYMLTRLIAAELPRPVLLSGVIWAAWHTPLIFAGLYAVGRFPLLSPLLFAIGVIAASYLYARVRLESGSVWPAVLAHASWNAVIQGTFDPFTAGGSAAPATTLWTGESGPLVVAFLVLYCWLFTRKQAATAVPIS